LRNGGQAVRVIGNRHGAPAGLHLLLSIFPRGSRGMTIPGGDHNFAILFFMGGVLLCWPTELLRG
jgi:hypothetical protein